MIDFILYEQHGGIVILTMNDPDRRNPVSNTRAKDFVKSCERLNLDSTVKAVILTGAGDAFSAGGDISAMKARIDAGISDPSRLRDEIREGIQKIPEALSKLEIPIIAAINGPAIGAGCDLACMCDIRIASKNAKFAESFIKMGLVAADGGAWFLPRVVGMAKASQMAFTGEFINAEEALSFGLVSEVVEPDLLLIRAVEIAEQIEQHSGPALRMTKRLLHEGRHLSLESALEIAANMQVIAFQSEQHKDAVRAFFADRI